MDKSKKIAIVIGTKAELIKCMPIMVELQRRKIPYWFIHTGQHPLKEACKEFGIKEPDFILSEEPDRKKGSKFWAKINFKTFIWCWGTMFTIRKLIKKLKPDYVLYHGDTMNTAMAVGASSGFLNPKKSWKTVHLEAGLRSDSLFEPFPEEFTRQVADRFSDLLLAPSDLAVKNLKKIKFTFAQGKIINVGNTGIDSSMIIYEKVKKLYKNPQKNYALINLHRYENLKNKKRMRIIVDILKLIKIEAIWPIHNPTKDILEKYGLMQEIKRKKNIKLVPLTNYKEFIFLLANCKYLVTDGGSIQEESLVFKKPCIITRKVTERPEGLETGINFLTELNVKYTKELIESLEKSDLKIKKFKNPYGEKGLSKKIVDILTK